MPLLPSLSSEMHYATPEVMTYIRSVIKDSDTPSWLQSVPHNFGAAAAGSLKADEWRTITTVYLPIALVSLWGEGTRQLSPAVGNMLRKTLDHTMDLISATTLASLRTMTQNRATWYQKYIISWLSQFPELHPDFAHDRRPNKHMAVHIYDFLILFGPVRSWWCFPFERLIGHLGRLPRNNHFGSYLM